MDTPFTIPLPKEQKKRLKTAALRYGFSAEELSRRIIADATNMLLGIPEESLNEYDNANEIRRALTKAFRDERAGKVLRSLPKRLRGR